MNQTDIKIIEDLSLNAWPSHQMQIYDGWILRFSHFYTHRTNCVEQIGAGQIPPEEKISYCETIYRRWGTPCIFKITPLTDPLFDEMLENRGYEVQHTTTVMCRELAEEAAVSDIPEISCGAEEAGMNLAAGTDGAVIIEKRISDEWIDALFSIKGNATVTHLKIVPSMYAAIPKDVICACIKKDGQIAATGLGILDRDYIGIYAINVDAACRRRGYAEKICRTLLKRGARAGAARAYLQVVSDNDPAISLYQKLGFTAGYQYWFRVRNVQE